LWSIICFYIKSNWVQNYATEVLLFDSSQTLAGTGLLVTIFQWGKKSSEVKTKCCTYLLSTMDYQEIKYSKPSSWEKYGKHALSVIGIFLLLSLH